MGNNEIQKAERGDQLAGMVEKFAPLMNSQSPSRGQIAELRRALKDMPELGELLGDLSVSLQSKIVTMMAPGQEALQVVLLRRAAGMTREMDGERSTVVERLLIDQVVTNWLWLQSAQWDYAKFQGAGGTYAKGSYLDRRLTSAQRRFESSVESLARVRGLLRRLSPQVNVAHQMIVQNSG